MLKLVGAVLVLAFLSSGVWAQDVIPPAAQAGVVRKELSKQEPKLELEKYVPEIKVPETIVGDVQDAGPVFYVKGFKFEGHKEISAEQLAKLPFVEKCINETVSVGQLKQLCVELTRFYRQQGFLLARVYLPEQEITDGVVCISVREVELDRIVVESNKFYGDGFILKHFARIKGSSVNYNDILRSLLVVNEFADLRVRSFFKKGTRPWTTELVLDVVDERPLRVYAEYNNHGSRYVSRDREKLGVVWGNAFVDGDSVLLEGLWGMPLDAQMFYNLGYDIALGGSGLKLGAGYSYSDFSVGQDFKDLDSTGDSHSGFMRMWYPVIRTAAVSMDSELRLELSDSKNYLLGAVSSEDKLRSLAFNLNCNRVDSWQGRNYLNLGFEQGLGDFLNGSKSGQDGLSRQGAVTDFSKLTVFAARIQSLPHSMMFMLSATGQYCDDRLPSGEQFAVGGVDTVRGYYPSSCLGDSGIGLKAQFWFDLPFAADHKVPLMNRTWKEFLRFELFLDYGNVFLNAPLDGEKKQRDIVGTGFGVQAFFPYEITVDFSLGFALDKTSCNSVPESIAYLKVFKEFF